MKRVLLLMTVSMVLAASLARADVVTLPAVASIQGGNPFFSDVRVFNTSYTSSLSVTATYHCFIPSPCTAGTPQIQFTLAPRESQAFDDMVASAGGFNAHDTAGGVEFEFTGTAGQLVVTSRLFSTFPENSVGMFIPGLEESDAHPTTVLTSIRHDPSGTGSGFRTNVGVFNPGDAAANVTFTIFDNGTNQLGSPQTRQVPGHSGLQISAFFEAAGAGDVSTENAVIVVSSDVSVFSYAAVLDNRTADPIFVVGAPDQPQQPITPVPTVPVSVTPTPGAPTPTPTPAAGGIRTVNIGANGEHIYLDTVTGTNMTNIPVGTTVHWVWVDSTHSTTSDTGVWDSQIHSTSENFTFDHQFNTPGTFPYHCLVHGPVMNGTVIVN